MASRQNIEFENKKTARLEVRVVPEIKETIEVAARLTGVTYSDFIVASALQAANQAIEKQNLIRLSQDDAERFVDSFLNPKSPSKELREAAKRYRKRTGN
jgi:uncharacterized protein (DUF1778 family)